MFDSLQQGVPIRLIGLPYKATNAMVFAFIKDYGAISQTVKFGYCKDGRVDGTAVALLSSSHELDRALKTL